MTASPLPRGVLNGCKMPSSERSGRRPQVTQQEETPTWGLGDCRTLRPCALAPVRSPEAASPKGGGVPFLVETQAEVLGGQRLRAKI